METLASRASTLATRILNSNTFINICLLASFATLSARSSAQQKQIQALETQKEALIRSNKEMKRTVWGWKQQLYADAEVAGMDRIKAVFGDSVAVAASGANGEATGKLPAAKILI
ncbi:hypothetical protein AKJ16_DCAP02678 [Drosera capensis]